MPEPTPEQIASRNEVLAFVERVGRPLKVLAGKAKSAWFSRPDDELKGWIERGRAISEIQDSMGYKLIMETTAKEIEWAREQLEIGNFDASELRNYLKALRFLKEFILTVNKNADISQGILAGREAEISKQTLTFVKTAQVRQ